MSSTVPVTELLVAWSAGDRGALEQLLPRVQHDLRKRARAFMARERPGHTLQPTALVNEAYLKLIRQERVDWKNRAHFFAIAATAMRRVLVDHARQSDAAKRGGSATHVPLDEEQDSPLRGLDVDVLALNEALERLEAEVPRASKIVELRFFGGLDVKETAEVLEISRATVKRDWAFARAWLYRELSGEG